MKRTRILTEGKTKIIWEIDEAVNYVDIQNKDYLTAGDGAKQVEIAGMGEIANHTTCNVFKFLETYVVKTHFAEQIDSDAFRAKKCKMIPVEFVIRRIADGSYLKRNPESRKGDVFPKLVLEMFYKNDRLRDPLLVIDDNEKKFLLQRINLYAANTPNKPLEITEHTYLYEYRDFEEIVFEDIKEIEKRAKFVFLLLEKAFANLGVDLWDLKLEFGYASENNELILADVVDNSSWRITNKGVNLDKQRFRDGTATTKEIKNNFILVRELTSDFLQMTDINNRMCNPNIIVFYSDLRDEAEIRMVLSSLGYGYNIYSYSELFAKKKRELLRTALREKTCQNSVVICENSIYGDRDLKCLLDGLIAPVILFPNLGNIFRKESGLKEAACEALKYVAQTNPLVYANLMMEVEENQNL